LRRLEPLACRHPTFWVNTIGTSALLAIIRECVREVCRRTDNCPKIPCRSVVGEIHRIDSRAYRSTCLLISLKPNLRCVWNSCIGKLLIRTRRGEGECLATKCEGRRACRTGGSRVACVSGISGGSCTSCVSCGTCVACRTCVAGGTCVSRWTRVACRTSRSGGAGCCGTCGSRRSPVASRTRGSGRARTAASRNVRQIIPPMNAVANLELIRITLKARFPCL
jgi:hypothetical protein